MIRRSFKFRFTPSGFVVAVLAVSLASTTIDAECLGPSHDSQVPCGITLVGATAGIVDTRGEFIIRVRDLAQNPVPDCEVMIDFRACRPDIRIAADQPHPGLRVECDANGTRILATTDANGIAVFRIVGAATAGSGGPAAAGFKCATVYAGSANLGTINVAAFDLNGGGGVNPADLSLFLPDSFGADIEGRSDYNCSNTVNPSDMSILIQAALGGGSFRSGEMFCN